MLRRASSASSRGDGELGAALVRARGVAKVFFTGSTEVGRKIAAAAGERLCPVTLELGGKDPMLVFADADVERALDGAAWGSFFNCGQVCSGVERIFVEEQLHDRSWPGSPGGRRRCGSGAATPSTAISARSSPRSSARRSRRSSRRPATRVVTGGGRPETGLPGWFYEPTVIAGSSDELRREEIFGPVVTVEPFASEEEAVRLANDTRYGLGASVWTRDAGAGAPRRRAARGRLGLDERRRLLLRRRPDAVGRLQGVRPRPHTLPARLLRLHAGQVRRGGLGPALGAMVVPVRRAGGRRVQGRARHAVRRRPPGEGRRRLAPPPRARPPREALPAMSDLSHVDEAGDVQHGRRRRQAALAPPRRRRGDRADGAGDGAPPARAAEGRRARDRAARRDHGREADGRADPALPPAAALARRGLARGRRGRRSRSPPSPRRPRRPGSRWRR